MISIAKSFGKIIEHPNGEIIKENRISGSANNVSFSRKYGTGAFPWHTDGANQVIPPRYVVLGVDGDKQRTTHVMGWDSLLRTKGNRISEILTRSVCVISDKNRSKYVTLEKAIINKLCRRFDPVIMKPENQSAKFVFNRAISDMNLGFIINWMIVGIAVIDNWKNLHARGPEPKNESERTIKRIYVEEI